MFEYTALKKEYVFENLGKGACVLCVDFKSMRVMDCATLLVGAVQSFIDSPDSLFYKRTEVVNE